MDKAVIKIPLYSSFFIIITKRAKSLLCCCQITPHPHKPTKQKFQKSDISNQVAKPPNQTFHRKAPLCASILICIEDESPPREPTQSPQGEKALIHQEGRAQGVHQCMPKGISGQDSCFALCAELRPLSRTIMRAQWRNKVGNLKEWWGTCFKKEGFGLAGKSIQPFSFLEMPRSDLALLLILEKYVSDSIRAFRRFRFWIVK